MTELVMTMKEEALLSRQAAQDAAAFAALYDLYFPKVYKYVFLRVQDVDITDDVTATIFTRALDRISTYRPSRAPFGAWLFRIAHNAVIDHYRKTNRRPTISLEKAANLPTMPPPDVKIEGQENIEALLSALKALSAREQEIVALKYASGLSNPHIARIQGIKAGHVAVILYRALRKLRKHLKGA